MQKRKPTCKSRRDFSVLSVFCFCTTLVYWKLNIFCFCTTLVYWKLNFFCFCTTLVYWKLNIFCFFTTLVYWKLNILGSWYAGSVRRIHEDSWMPVLINQSINTHIVIKFNTKKNLLIITLVYQIVQKSDYCLLLYLINYYSETLNKEYIERIPQMSYSSLCDNGILQMFDFFIKWLYGTL